MAVSLTIKVVPQSGKLKLITDKNGTIKCYLKSPPEDGKANKELITFLAKGLKLPTEKISIIQGATSRTKTIKIITDHDKISIYKLLGIEQQQTIL